MSRDQLIVGSYQNHADATGAVAALEAVNLALNKLSLIWSGSLTPDETIGFWKNGDGIASWGKPNALWERHPEAGFFVFPESGPLLVTGPLVRAIVKAQEAESTVAGGSSPLRTGLATLGLPKGYLHQYEKEIAGGSSLVIVRCDSEEITRIHDVFQMTRPARVQVHSMSNPNGQANDQLVKSKMPLPPTRFIMPVNRHIVFPVDFSQRSRELVPYVGAVARQFNSEVTLFHVLGPYEGLPSEPEMSSTDWPHYQDRLREQRESDLMELAVGALDDVNVTSVVESGEPAERILHYATEHNAGLIMMATHGRGTFRKMLLGSVTSKLLHDSAYPVWTTAHAETRETSPTRDVQKVVCALDPASDGRCMLEAAIDMASVYGAEIIIVHAVPVQAVGLEAGLDSGFSRFLSDTAKDLIAELQRAAGTKWEVHIETGDVAAVLRGSALQNHADLVIIGRGHLSETFGGLRTHVGAIIRQSPCPVLSVSNNLQVLC